MGSAVKESTCSAGDAGDTGSIPGSGRSPGGGNGNLLQYSCLENPMDRGSWGATVYGVVQNAHTGDYAIYSGCESCVAWTKHSTSVCLSFPFGKLELWITPLISEGCYQDLWGKKLSTNPSIKQVILVYNHHQGFPGGSGGKESACDAGDPGSVPGSGKPPEEGNGYPLLCSWLENPMDKGAWWAAVLGVAKSWTWLSS